jgi:Tfp pilus assembly protein PilZ
MKQRIEDRIHKRLVVSFGDSGFELLGLTGNISRGGMFIESHVLFPRNKEVSMMVAVSEDVLNIKGIVKWVKDSSDRMDNEGSGGMGIKITEAPVEYFNYVEYTTYASAV